MKKILLTSEINLEVDEDMDIDAYSKTEKWHRKVKDFLSLVDKTLITGVRYKDMRINIVEIKKES